MRQGEFGHRDHLQDIGSEGRLHATEVNIREILTETSAKMSVFKSSPRDKNLPLGGGVVNEDVQLAKLLNMTLDDFLAVCFNDEVDADKVALCAGSFDLGLGILGVWSLLFEICDRDARHSFTSEHDRCRASDTAVTTSYNSGLVFQPTKYQTAMNGSKQSTHFPLPSYSYRNGFPLSSQPSNFVYSTPAGEIVSGRAGRRRRLRTLQIAIKSRTLLFLLFGKSDVGIGGDNLFSRHSER